jgi:6-phosphogluconolactonase
VKINIFKTEDEVLSNLAAYFVIAANKAIDARGRCSVALSGGTSPKKLYELLSSAAFKDQVVWQKLDFFFGDERNVPQTDTQSNYLMAKKTLFEPLHIDPKNVFAVDTELKPAEAAEKYTETIRNYFGLSPLQFDIILLGLGDNSHTASLFPHTTVLSDTTSSVKAVFLDDQKVYRITFTAPLINQAHAIAFLVYGKSKAIAVQHVIEGDKDIDNFPAQLVQPLNGELQWFIDEAASGALTTIF